MSRWQQIHDESVQNSLAGSNLGGPGQSNPRTAATSTSRHVHRDSSANRTDLTRDAVQRNTYFPSRKLSGIFLELTLGEVLVKSLKTLFTASKNKYRCRLPQTALNAHSECPFSYPGSILTNFDLLMFHRFPFFC